jgi:hypothetical protein
MIHRNDGLSIIFYHVENRYNQDKKPVSKLEKHKISATSISENLSFSPIKFYYLPILPDEPYYIVAGAVAILLYLCV